MATVPILQQQVAPEALPGVRQSFDLPDLSGIGKQAVGVGGTIGGIVEQIDNVKVASAQAAANKRLNDLQAQAYALRGVNAQNAVQDFTAGAQKIKAETMQGMTPRQQEMFTRAFEPMYNGADFSVQRHVQSQLTEADVNAQQALAQTSIDGYVQNIGDGKQMDANRGTLVGAVNRLADLQGLAPETKALLLQRQLSDMHVAAINRLRTLGRSSDAIAYLEANKGEIDQKYHSELLGQARAEDELGRAQTTVDAYRELYGTNYDAMEQAARADKALLGRPRELVMNQIEQLRRQNREVQAQADVAGMTKFLTDQVAGKIPANIPPVQVQQLYGDMAFKQWATAKAKTETSAANTAEAKALALRAYDVIDAFPLAGTAEQKRQNYQQFFSLITDIRNADQDAAKGLEGLYHSKIVESQKMNDGLKAVLYDRQTGIFKQIKNQVQSAAQSGINALDDTEVLRYSQEVFNRIEKVAKEHASDWSPVQLQDYWENDPQMKEMRIKTNMRRIYQQLVAGPQASFRPGDLKPQPIIINLPDNAAAALSNVLAKSVTQK